MDYFSLFIIIAPFMAIIVFSFLIHRKKREALKRLPGHLTGYVPKFSFYPTFNGEYQGLKFSIVLISESKNSPAYLKISLSKGSFFNLTIYRESFLSELGKKIGIVHEARINDEIFDKEFLIFSNKPTQAIAYLNNSNIKNTIRELFSRGFNAFFIDGKKILIRKPNYELQGDLEPAAVIDVLQKLSSLAQCLYTR